MPAMPKPKKKTGAAAKRAVKPAIKPLVKKVAKKPATSPVGAASSPTNKDIYRRFYEEVLNGGKFELATEFLDPVVVSHNPLPGQQPGVDGFVAALTEMRRAFPDLRAVATQVVAEGDHVAARLHVTATHQGDFFGLRATGREIHYEEHVLVRFAGGRIVEHWAVADGLAIMQQLGGEMPR
jgi:predicted ester cyclase